MWRQVVGVLMLLAGATGCATQPPCDDPSIQTAIGAALDRASAPTPADLPGCLLDAAVLDQAWRQRACTPEGGWRLGLAGRDLPAACDTDDRWLREGLNLGREYRRIQAALSAARSAAEHQGLDVARHTREMDAIEGVARIKGWPLPDHRGDLP